MCHYSASGLKVQSVNTTEEMLSAVVKELSSGKYDVFISAAAPADYASVSPQKGKISTTEKNRLTIELGATSKIIEAVRKKFPEIFISFFQGRVRLE